MEVLSQVFGIKPDSLGRNLRNHGYSRLSNPAVVTEIQQHWPLLMSRALNWSLWNDRIGHLNQPTTQSQNQFLSDDNNIDWDSFLNPFYFE
jgi:hypothetical protein